MLGPESWLQRPAEEEEHDAQQERRRDNDGVAGFEFEIEESNEEHGRQRQVDDDLS